MAINTRVDCSVWLMISDNTVHMSHVTVININKAVPFFLSFIIQKYLVANRDNAAIQYAVFSNTLLHSVIELYWSSTALFPNPVYSLHSMPQTMYHTHINKNSI